MKSMTATDAKDRFGEMLAVAEREPLSIPRNGRVVVVAMPADSEQRPTGIDPATVDHKLEMYSQALLGRFECQDATGLAFEEMLLRMGELELTLLVVRTRDRFSAAQRANYEEPFERK
jgi:hypothetical protein